MPDEPRGPGETTYHVSDDDSRITKKRWNDPSWETHLCSLENLRPWEIAALLRKAYLEGFDDRATFICNALGVKQ